MPADTTSEILQVLELAAQNSEWALGQEEEVQARTGCIMTELPIQSLPESMLHAAVPEESRVFSIWVILGPILAQRVIPHCYKCSGGCGTGLRFEDGFVILAGEERWSG